MTDQQTQPVQQTPENDEKLFAAIGYLFFLFVVPLIVKPKSEYCKFHARQSMVLFLISILILVVLAAVPWFGSLLTMALFALYVLAIYRSYMGDSWKIPFVFGLSQKFNLDAMYGKAGATVAGLSTGIKSATEGLTSKATEAVKTMGKQEEATPTASPVQAETTPPETAPPPAQAK